MLYFIINTHHDLILIFDILLSCFKSTRKYVYEESMMFKKLISSEIHNKLISLKVDAVTRMNRSFLGINLQYIVDDFIKLRTIGLVELTESHTGYYYLYNKKTLYYKIF